MCSIVYICDIAKIYGFYGDAIHPGARSLRAPVFECRRASTHRFVSTLSNRQGRSIAANPDLREITWKLVYFMETGPCCERFFICALKYVSRSLYFFPLLFFFTFLSLFLSRIEIWKKESSSFFRNYSLRFIREILLIFPAPLSLCISLKRRKSWKVFDRERSGRGKIHVNFRIIGFCLQEIRHICSKVSCESKIKFQERKIDVRMIEGLGIWMFVLRIRSNNFESLVKSQSLSSSNESWCEYNNRSAERNYCEDKRTYRKPCVPLLFRH